MLTEVGLHQHVFWIINDVICQGNVAKIYVTGSVLLHKLGDATPMVIRMPDTLFKSVLDAQAEILARFKECPILEKAHLDSINTPARVMHPC
jgi:hypothetical protein